MESVYLETSIIGYLASRPSKDVLVSANQLVTHKWWNHHRLQYKLLVSQAVIDECGDGDPTAAAERQVFLEGLTVLQFDPTVTSIARELIKILGLPEKAAYDAFHIAIAAQNGIDFLLTWNCKHIANPALWRKISKVLSASGLESPIICTPQELLGE